MKPQERTRAILASKLDSETKLVLIAIADCMDEDDHGSFLSIKTGLVERTGLQKRTIQRRIHIAIRAGLLSRSGKDGQPRQYWAMDWSRLTEGCHTVTGATQSPVTDRPERGDSVTPEGCQAGTRSDHDPTKDPTRGDARARDPQPGSATPDPAPPPSGPCGLTGREVAGRMLEAITGHAASVDGRRLPKAIAVFLEAFAGCEPAGLLSDVALVAEAARECPDPLFADEIRADGWKGKRDWSRRPGTVLDPSRWFERLAAARAWDAVGRPGKGVPKRAANLNGKPLTRAQRIETWAVLRDQLAELDVLVDSGELRREHAVQALGLARELAALDPALERARKHTPGFELPAWALEASP